MRKRPAPHGPPAPEPYDSADAAFAARLLGERYEVLRLLGRGHLASTHLVRDRASGRRAAARIVHDAIARDDSARSHIRRLARAGLAIDHPNVVRTWEVAPETEGVPYMICEYVEGTDLGTLMAREGALPVARALGIARDIAAALAAAHAHGIVSGNLRPGDVLVEAPGGRAKVYDFDSPLFGEAGLLGNPRYAAPELLQDSGSGPRPAADLFALGGILYEMLTGAPAFPAANGIQEMMRKTRGEWTPLGEHRADVPRAVENVISFLLSPDPAARGTAEQALGELTVLLEG